MQCSSTNERQLQENRHVEDNPQYGGFTPPESETHG